MRSTRLWDAYFVIAKSQRVRAKRGPMTGSATKQSGLRCSEPMLSIETWCAIAHPKISKFNAQLRIRGLVLAHHSGMTISNLTSGLD
jgi:hypothetical protein